MYERKSKWKRHEYSTISSWLSDWKMIYYNYILKYGNDNLIIIILYIHWVVDCFRVVIWTSWLVKYTGSGFFSPWSRGSWDWSVI